MVLGVSILTFGTSLILFVPETLHMRIQASGPTTLTPDLATDHSASNTKIDSSTFVSAARSQAINSLRRLHESASVLHSLPILLLLTTFVMQPVNICAVELSPRYVSKRFSWTLRQAGFLLSLRAFVNIVLLIGVLPLVSRILTQWFNLASKAKDLFLAQISVIFLIIGSTLIAASPTISLSIAGLVVWTLGTGFVPLCRSIITTLVDQQHIGRLYAAIAFVQVVAQLAAGPTLAASFSLGLKLRGPWVGLPYYLVAVMSLLAGVGLWTFRLLKDRKPDGEERLYPSGRSDDVEREPLSRETEVDNTHRKGNTNAA